MRKYEGQEELNSDEKILPSYEVFSNELYCMIHDGFLILTHYKLTQIENA